MKNRFLTDEIEKLEEKLEKFKQEIKEDDKYRDLLSNLFIKKGIIDEDGNFIL